MLNKYWYPLYLAIIAIYFAMCHLAHINGITVLVHAWYTLYHLAVYALHAL